MPKYRFIEDLHNIHKGEEIWVLGCGPSLDDFPDDFFDEKKRIAIASSWSLVAFPNSAYFAFSRAQKGHLQRALERGRDVLNKCIVRLTPTQLKNKAFIGPEPIYLRINEGMDLMTTGKEVPYFASLSKNLINGTLTSFASTGTCIHSEIQVAIVMGAKKVTLAGCDTKNLKFQGHAYKRGLDKIYKAHDQIPKNGYSVTLVAGQSQSQQRMRTGTAYLAKIMKPHGVQIANFHYGKGYGLLA